MEASTSLLRRLRCQKPTQRCRETCIRQKCRWIWMVFWGRKNHANLGIEKKNPQPEAYRRFVTVSCASVLLNGTDPSLWEKKPWINPITPGLKIPFCQSCFFSMNQSNYQNPQQESPSVPNCSTNNIGIEFCLAKNVKKKNIATMCLKVVCNVGIIFLQMVAT